MNRSIAKLKDQARNHELNEAWGEAILAYQRILEIEEEGEEEGDLSLFNRIGDLYLRVGKPADAVRYYELAADRYEAAGLYNGAIALCNKAIRQAPDRPEPFLKLTRLTLAQGFISEARRWSLEFAERTFKTKGREAALGALQQLASYAAAPEIHELFAEFLQARNEITAAVAQLRAAYDLRLGGGEADAVDLLREMILALDPDAIFTTSHAESDVEPTPRERGRWDAVRWEDEPPEDYADPALVEEAGTAVDDAEVAGIAGLEPTALQAPAPTASPTDTLPQLQLETAADSAGIEELPLLTSTAVETLALEPTSIDPVSSAEVEHGSELDDEPEDTGLAPLPLLGVPSLVAEPAVEEPLEPVEPLLDLEAGTPDSEQSDAIAPAPVGQPAEKPVASADSGWGDMEVATGFVDLATLLQDEDAAEPGQTRYMVEAPTPTGDEDRDFLELLTQFRSKVEEHLGEDDAESRYDLGLAFKEMGLYDEAIAQFQLALRGVGDPLKIYEELGDCFISKGSYTIALKVLQNALRLSEGRGGELLGIYYNLGRSYEELGQAEEARDAYERVLALDLEFRDAANRLARL